MDALGRKEKASFLPRYGWLLAVFFLLLAKHLLVIRLPIEARDYRIDDFLMVQMAESLVRGDWLGDYSANVLMKGCFFPMLLAGFHRLGIPYLSALDILHGLSCVFFVRQLRFLLKSRGLRLILLTLLLFDPCSFSLTNFQRVYRSSIVEIQVLCLFGGCFGLYFHYRNRELSSPAKKLPIPAGYAAFIGFVMWAAWNTREETVWMLPFVITAFALVLAEIIRLSGGREKALRFFLPHLLVLLLPFLILAAGNQLIRLKNAQVYGERVRLEEVDGNFGKALKMMYSIKDREPVPRVSVTREKLERMYACSPTLAMIRPELEENLEYYAGIDSNPHDGEVEDGWLIWALKKAAFTNGAADTLPKSQAYWLRVCRELQAAAEDPACGFEIRKTPPSALMSPWRPEYAAQLPPSMLAAAGYLVSYREVAPSVEPSGKAGRDTTRRFEAITGNLALYSDGFSDPILNSGDRALEDAYRVMVKIGGVYRAANRLLAVLSLGAFAALLFLYGKRKSRELASGILVILGLGLSILVVMLGVCYTHISAFPAIRYYYLIGAYPLMLGCEGIAVLLPVQQFLNSRRFGGITNGTTGADNPDAMPG